MNILITGSSGLIGSALMQTLGPSHTVVGLQRGRASDSKPYWDIQQQQIDLNGFSPQVIIHLAGENIATGRWTEKKKQRLYNSRIDGTRLLVDHIMQLAQQPQLLISASAIGYYGDRGDQLLHEDAPPGDDFVSHISTDWEQATSRLNDTGTRVINMRTGLVLSRHGGALKKMLLPFKLGLGGRIGSGQQYYSWISIDDVAAAIEHMIHTPQLSGPVNLAAPHPVTNARFTQQLAAELKRPAVLPMPAFAARLVFGEMADELLLARTRVSADKLIDSGYQFRHPHLPQALQAVLQA